MTNQAQGKPATVAEQSDSWVTGIMTFISMLIIAAAAGWIAGQYAASGSTSEATPVVVLSVSDWMASVEAGASEEEAFARMGEARQISRMLSESGVIVLRQDAVVDAPASVKITPDAMEGLLE